MLLKFKFMHWLVGSLKAHGEYFQWNFSQSTIAETRWKLFQAHGNKGNPSSSADCMCKGKFIHSSTFSWRYLVNVTRRKQYGLIK